MTVDLPREVALKIIYDINEKGAYSNISLNKYLEGYELKDVDRAFITELVYGTVKWRLSLDWIIGQFSSIKLRKISPWILNILRLGAYQVLYTDKVPESAACNESVKLSKKYGHAAASGFVNGVLRSIARNRDKIKYPDKKSDFENYLSVKYSHPLWLVKEWIGKFGNEFTESLLDSNNGLPEFTIRVNTLKTTREKLMEELIEAGIEAAEGKYVRDALVLKNPSAVTKLEAFKKGLFQVQDESSMLVGKVLDPKPGEYVIDVCSAPGGKSTHIAQLMQNKGEVSARDIHEHKIKIISDAAKRLGTDIVKPMLSDASVLDEASIGKADRVLVDAPCTGLGILRRKPDIKWARNIQDKKEIIELQKKILSNASNYIKQGGVLVYSTCTVESEENEEIVEYFLKNNKEFEAEDISAFLPDKLRKDSAADGYVQFFPNTDGIDGFFISRFRKR